MVLGAHKEPCHRRFLEGDTEAGGPECVILTQANNADHARTGP